MKTSIEMEEDKLDQVAELMKILGNPMRLKIIALLAEGGQLSVSTIQKRLEAEQSLVSHHLLKMKDRNILARHRQSKKIYYSLNNPNLVTMLNMLMTT